MDENPFFKEDEETKTAVDAESDTKQSTDSKSKTASSEETPSEDSESNDDEDEEEEEEKGDILDADEVAQGFTKKKTSGEVKAAERDIVAKIKAVPDWQEYLVDKDLLEDLFFEIETDLEFEQFTRIARALKKDKDFKTWAEENL